MRSIERLVGKCQGTLGEQIVGTDDHIALRGQTYQHDHQSTAKPEPAHFRYNQVVDIGAWLDVVDRQRAGDRYHAYERQPGDGLTVLDRAWPEPGGDCFSST